MKHKLSKIKKQLYPSKSFVGLLLSIIILISPLFTNKYIMGHDNRFHITNMLATHEYADISKFNFYLPKIFGGKVARGFGYGTGIFYPPLSYYLTAYITNILNLNKTNNLLSLPIVEILIIILSGISMYTFMKKVFKDNRIAGLGAISYISSTYFLCNVYVRTALAELLTFVFIPLVFLGLYELFFEDERKFSFPFVLGYIGMICSQLVMTVYLTIFIIIIFIINYKKVFKINKIKKLIIASITVLLITSPYLVPLLEHKIFGNYVVFEPGSMYIIEGMKHNALGIEDFLIIKNFSKNGLRVFINPMILIISIITIIFSKKTFKDNKIIYKIIITLLIITTFMTSKCFPWYKMPSILNTIQFPWRLRTFGAFLLAILSGNIVKIIKCKYNNVIIIFLALSITIVGYININKSKIISIEDFLQQKVIFDHPGVQKEYLPVKAKKHIGYYYNRSNEVIIKKGEAEIILLKDELPELEFEIKITSEKAILELPRLYYLGYKIQVIDSLGNINDISYYENPNGFIEIILKNSGIVKVSYDKTVANKISEYIPMLTITIYLAIIIYKNKQKKV